MADTNILSFVLEGVDAATTFLEGKDIYISIINKIELLIRKDYSKTELEIVHAFLEEVEIVHTTDLIAQYAVNLRRTHHIKLPDALIGATAIALNIPLITADQALFKISEIDIIQFFH